MLKKKKKTNPLEKKIYIVSPMLDNIFNTIIPQTWRRSSKMCKGSIGMNKGIFTWRFIPQGQF